MKYMFAPLRRYADFTGRSRRKEFWLFFLFQMIVFVLWAVAFTVLVVAIGANDQLQNGSTDFLSASEGLGAIILLGLWIIWVLAMAVPNAAVIVRRCHDQDITGWVGALLYGSYFVMFIFFFPLALIAAVPLLILMCIDGKPARNAYGPDPKGRETDVFR